MVLPCGVARGRRGRSRTSAPGSAEERPQGALAPSAGERCGARTGGTGRRDRRSPDEAARGTSGGAFGELGALARGIRAAPFGGSLHRRGRGRDVGAVGAAALSPEAPFGEREPAGHRGAYPEPRTRARGARG